MAKDFRSTGVLRLTMCGNVTPGCSVSEPGKLRLAATGEAVCGTHPADRRLGLPQRTIMRPRLAYVLLAFARPLVAQEPADHDMLAKIRAEGLNHSRAWSYVDTMATVFGPRLTGSPAHVKA